MTPQDQPQRARTLAGRARAATRPVPAVEIVIPVHNEQHVLAASLRRVHAFMTCRFTCAFRITIVDNASTDDTLAVAHELAGELQAVRVMHLEGKGRGRALRAAWSLSDADVLAYMDVDLSTDLEALPALLEPLLAGRGDITIGSRLVPGAEVTRSPKRELISRCYNLLLRATLGVTFADAQCGFKAGRREALQPLLARVEDDDWFFDTELLYVAQRSRLSIREVPVRWVEDTDSRVAILRTALADLRGIRRLRERARVTAPQPEPEPLRTPSGRPSSGAGARA
jgi:glycosyltransferase involved in cell wall biosynthesis